MFLSRVVKLYFGIEESYESTKTFRFLGFDSTGFCVKVSEVGSELFCLPCLTLKLPSILLSLLNLLTLEFSVRSYDLTRSSAGITCGMLNFESVTFWRLFSFETNF